MVRIPLLDRLTRWGSGRLRDIPLHQYWHDGHPPEEIARHVAAWQALPGFSHRLFDQHMALAFVSRHAGPRVAACFRACAVPAMQSDLFRYVAIHARGGIYIDADNTPGPDSLLEFLRTVPAGLLCRRRNETAEWFCNDALFARRPGHPLFARLIELACENIEAREQDDVWSVTGPYLLNRLNKSPNEHLFQGLTFAWYDDEMRRFVSPVGKLAYKKGPQDWRVFKREGRSIYVQDGDQDPPEGGRSGA